MRVKKRRVLVIVTGLLLSGCSQNLYMQGRKFANQGQHEEAIGVFQQQVEQQPDSWQAWCELGVSFYELGRLERAHAALQHSLQITPQPRTQLYLGLTYEKQAQYGKAQAAYEASLHLDPPGKLVKIIRARQNRLARLDEIQAVLAREREIEVDAIPTNTIAVYDFDGSSLPADLAPLAIGLAEFTANSLAKVKSLEVIERLQLKILQQELKLVEQDVVDPSTAPRLGKLLGSRQIVTGWVENPTVEQLRMGSAIINTIDSSEAFPDVEEGKLRKIIKLQIAFVYQILEELGIEPDEQERKAIETLPTESYEAFLAYSRGLQHRERGEFQQAEEQFEQAVEIDNEFSEAASQAEETAELAEQEEFESIVETETAGEIPDLGSTLGDVVTNTTTVPSPTEEEPTTPPVAEEPPKLGTGALSVEGKFDGR